MTKQCSLFKSCFDWLHQEYLKAEEYAAEWGVPLDVLYSSTQAQANTEAEVEEEVEQDESITEETINNKFKGLEL